MLLHGKSHSQYYIFHYNKQFTYVTMCFLCKGYQLGWAHHRRLYFERREVIMPAHDLQREVDMMSKFNISGVSLTSR